MIVIDNIFTNQINPDTKSGNFILAILDDKDNQLHLPKKQQIYARDMKYFDKIHFTFDYLNIDWYEKLERYKDNANNAFLFFHWQINRLLDKYMS